MNIEELKEERQSYYKRMSYLNAIILFQEVIDYLKQSPDIETFELCLMGDNTRYIEEALFVHLTGPTYNEWKLEPIFNFFSQPYHMKNNELRFPPKTKMLLAEPQKIVFTRESKLGDMLERYTSPEVFTTYQKEFLHNALSSLSILSNGDNNQIQNNSKVIPRIKAKI